jgi:hypothetical protein
VLGSVSRATLCRLTPPETAGNGATLPHVAASLPRGGRSTFPAKAQAWGCRTPAARDWLMGRRVGRWATSRARRSHSTAREPP